MTKKSFMYSAIIDGPVGKIGIATADHQLTKLAFLAEDCELKSPTDELSKKICAELKKYFNHPKHQFNIDLVLNGTPFQKKVWQFLQKIPSGQTQTYGEVAKKLQTGPRAIGQACRTNRITIIIPCHRIVAAHHLGGFGGETSGNFMAWKKWLLQHEKSNS